MKSWKVLLPLFMVIFVDVMGLCIVFPVLAPLFYNPQLSILPANTSLAMRNLFYGLMMTMWPIFMFIAAPIIGDLSDKLGRKRVILLCLFGEAASYLIGAAAITTSSMILFLLSRILAGVFSGSQPIAQAAIADISTPETKTRNMSNIVLAATLGVVLGPLIGGFTSAKELVSWFNFATPFQIAAAIALLNAVLLMATFKETHPQKKEQKLQLMKSLFLFAGAFKNKKIRFLSVAFLLIQLSWSLYFQSLAYFLVKKFNFNASHIGIFYGVIGLAATISLTYFIRFLIKLLKSDKHIFIIGAVFQVFGAVCAVVFNLLGWQYTAVSLSAIGIALTYTVGISLYSNSVGGEHQGWIMGISAAICGAAWAITAIMTGALMSISLILPFSVSAVLAALSLLFIYRTGRG
jgi:MFS family permease